MPKKRGGPFPFPTSRSVAYRVPQPVNDEGDEVFTGPLAARTLRGWKTNIPKPPYPPVFRRFGNNTRVTVYPLPKTGVLDNIYDAGLFDPGKGASSLIPGEHHALLGQGGATQDVLHRVPAFAPGSHHWLFATGR